MLMLWALLFATLDSRADKSAFPQPAKA